MSEVMNTEESGATDSPLVPAGAPAASGGSKSRMAAARDAVGAFVGALLGLVPHVLHHIGFIAGAAFVTGFAGNAVFFLLGLVLSIPLLRRLYARFGTWRAPATAVAVFAAAFTFSALVIGPALTGSSGDPSEAPSGPDPTPSQNHSDHHG